MENNININNFFPVYKTGISYQPVGANSNQTVYLSMSADPTKLDNNLYKEINSAKDFLKLNGGNIDDTEYKTLVNYFKGIDYRVSGGANVSPPKSCIIASIKQGVDVVGKIESGSIVLADALATIVAWANKDKVNLTFNFNNQSYPLIIDCTSLTVASTGIQVANLIQTALQKTIFTKATCTYTTNKLIIKPYGDIAQNIVVGYCTSTTPSTDLAVALHLITGQATTTNGLDGYQYIGDVMQKLVNLGVTNFYAFQTLFSQYDITNSTILDNITSAIDFTETQNINFTFLYTNKLSNLTALRDKLVELHYLEKQTDSLGQDIYIPTKGSFQISFLADGNNMGIPRTQADKYENSVIGGSIVGASGNRYAQTSAYCRNPFFVKYAGEIEGALFNEDEETDILSMGAFAYSTFSGNAENFVGCMGSGRNTKDLVWFDLAQNAVYMGYRIQLRMVKLAQKGKLNEANARVEMQSCVQELLEAELIKPPKEGEEFNWENNLIDNEYMSYAALREFGSESSIFKNQVQNAINSKGMSFNIIPYQGAVNQSSPFKDFVTFIYATKISTSAFKSLKRKLQKEGKMVIVLKNLPEDIKIKLASLPNKLLATGEHKPIIVNFNNNSNDHTSLEDHIITYTPTTIRERGLINIADFTPQQWFNGVSTYLNQLNIG